MHGVLTHKTNKIWGKTNFGAPPDPRGGWQFLINAHRALLETMEKVLSDGVFIEEIQSEALDVIETNQAVFKEGFVRYLPSGQVSQ